MLDIAGDGDPDYLQRLHLHCAALGLAPHVKWHGFVEGVRKQALLQQADWFVLPSASENFGIAAAEALMSGTPVVLSPGVALASNVQKAHAGLVCEPKVRPSLSASSSACNHHPCACARQQGNLLINSSAGVQSVAS